MTLLRSALVGIATGAVACVFFYALEWAEYLFLGRLAGYVPLRPGGEHPLTPQIVDVSHFRPIVLVFVPALGALLAGVIGYFAAPETLGGGSDAFINAFHQHKGEIRRRVAPIKLLTSVLTLGAGGSGGREGPTMQIGAALGSLVGRAMRLTTRERRILLVAGTAGGMAAIFRTPLGAALLAVEALYRDDFEADALIPAILASVTSYSIFVTVFPDTGHLFEHAPNYPFEPRHLPLYILMAVLLSLAALLFIMALHRVHKQFEAVRLPTWCKPALGGLLLGALAVSWILIVNPKLSLAYHGVGILGSGYGAAQGAITGAAWIRPGWRGVEILAALALVKIVATSLTIGSGGSAGDFGPSLAIGGLLGGAFGRAAQILVDPTIDPGAFALVGMGTFYGGLAHVPVSSAVMVCEMAGSYDLLVPLMLAEGVAFIALRHVGLYGSQMRTRFESPAHASDATLDVLKSIRAADRVQRNRGFATVTPQAHVTEIVRTVSGASQWQDVFPVIDPNGKLVGLLSGDAIRTLVREPGLENVAVAADVMSPPITIDADDDLHTALEMLLESGLRELPVLDETGTILGLLDESEIARTYHDDITRLQSERGSMEGPSSSDLKPEG
jgi:CIC family chloride channel protein